MNPFSKIYALLSESFPPPISAPPTMYSSLSWLGSGLPVCSYNSKDEPLFLKFTPYFQTHFHQRSLRFPLLLYPVMVKVRAVCLYNSKDQPLFLKFMPYLQSSLSVECVEALKANSLKFWKESSVESVEALKANYLKFWKESKC